METHFSVGRLISIIHRSAHVYFQKEFGPLGLGHGQVRILKYLEENDGATQNEITNVFMLDKGTISSAIKYLEKGAFIRRERDEKDKRIFRLFLTEKAIAIRPQLREVFQNWTHKLLQNFKEEEKELVYDFLNRMVENTDFIGVGKANKYEEKK